MANTYNPAVKQGVAVPVSAGDIVMNRFIYDFAQTSYADADINDTDTITIGVVPAGCKLVPHLSRISIPILDTNGAPTGDYSLGTATDPDALKGSAAAETAVVLSGEDFTVLTSELGAKASDVEVILTAIGNVATTTAVGKIYVELAIRPYDSRLDSDVL